MKKEILQKVYLLILLNSNLRVHKRYNQQVGVIVILYTLIRNVSCSDVIFIKEKPNLLQFFLVLVGKARLIPSNIHDQGQATWRARRAAAGAPTYKGR
jgi:hypothetical protein